MSHYNNITCARGIVRDYSANIHANITTGYVTYTSMKYFPLYAFALLCVVIIELQSNKAKKKRNKASRSALRACFKPMML